MQGRLSPNLDIIPFSLVFPHDPETGLRIAHPLRAIPFNKLPKQYNTKTMHKTNQNLGDPNIFANDVILFHNPAI